MPIVSRALSSNARSLRLVRVEFNEIYWGLKGAHRYLFSLENLQTHQLYLAMFSPAFMCQ